MSSCVVCQGTKEAVERDKAYTYSNTLERSCTLAVLPASQGFILNLAGGSADMGDDDGFYTFKWMAVFPLS